MLPLDLIGNTPLVRLHNIEPTGVELYAKMESENLSGSVKARIALAMILEAEARGVLRPGAKILEPTSGNTGIALAAISSLRGYSFSAVVSRSVTKERVDLLRAYGAEVIFSSAEGGSNGAIRLAEEIIQENNEYVFLNQYENPANPRSHEQGTAPEILRDLPEITTFVAGLGTGGTLTGCGRFFKQHNPEIQIVAAEPMPGENVGGLRSLEEGYIPPVLDLEQIDRKFLVSSKDSVYWARQLLQREALFCGASAGSNLAAAMRVAGGENNKIVFLVPDGGSRYLSTGMFSDQPAEKFDVYGWW